MTSRTETATLETERLAVNIDLLRATSREVHASTSVHRALHRYLLREAEIYVYAN